MTAHLIPWRLNLAIAVVQLAVALLIILVSSLATAWWQLALLSGGLAVVGNSIYALMHEAQHRILAPWQWLNDGLGVVLALFFPAPFHLLRQGHLGHHLRNRSDDEAFDFYFAGDNPVWKWLQLYGILSGFFWVTIVCSNLLVLLCPAAVYRRLFRFDRPSAALFGSLNPRYWPVIRCEAAAALTLHGLLIWGLNIPPTSYALVYSGFGFTWSAMQYVHHFGTGRDVVDGSRNLWLFAPLDVLWLHHNWHHTHHQHPTVPWIYLPALSAAKNADREFLLWHYLRMWRGPRATDLHVENRYAGQIIR